MTLTRLSIGFALAFGLMAQHARAAQSAESAADVAEAEAPDSILNKDRIPAELQRAAQSAESAADEAEAEGPDSVLNKDRNPVVPLDRPRQDRQVREAERNNPDSVDSRSDLSTATSAKRTIADN
jgi:hypothetical protein